MVQEEAEANGVPPKAGRGKRQAAADQNAAGPSNETAATKRPRGRPPKTSSGWAARTDAHCTHAGSKVAQGHGSDATRGRNPCCQQRSGSQGPENPPYEALPKLVFEKPK
ncbi:hypothetical protein MRX96_050763 [Rhipicephalus microplus]